MKRMPREKIDKEKLRRMKLLQKQLEKEELRKKELVLKRIKTNAAAKASRERAKFQNEKLQQKFTDLQNEKTKLLEENKSLIRKRVELLGENSSLKSKMQNMNSTPVKEENSNESDNKRPLFVSIPLFKLGKSQSLPEVDDIDGILNVASELSSYKTPLEFSLVEWLGNPEADCKNDSLFSLLDSELLSCENNKQLQAFDESSLNKQVLEGQRENTKHIDNLFGSLVINDLKPKFISESDSQFKVNGNSINLISNNAKLNRTFLEPLSRWTFDDLYED